MTLALQDALPFYGGCTGRVSDGASLVVDRGAGGTAGGGSSGEGGGIQPRGTVFRSDQRLRLVLDQQHGRGDRAEADAGGGADTVLQGQVDAHEIGRASCRERVCQYV